jgi:hypothetical protein
MNNIIQKLIKLQSFIIPKKDKLEHFYIGFIYTLIGYLIYKLTGFELSIVIPSFVFGAIKEINDYFGNGKTEFLDFLFTILPCNFTIYWVLCG